MVAQDVFLQSLDHSVIEQGLARKVGQLLLLELEQLYLSHSSLLIGVIARVDKLPLLIEIVVVLVPLNVGCLAHGNVVFSILN